MSHAQLSEEARRRVGEALAAGRKIEAIKIYREATGLGLKEAKEAVEALAGEGGGGPPGSVSPGGGCAGVVALVVLALAVLAI